MQLFDRQVNVIVTRPLSLSSFETQVQLKERSLGAGKWPAVRGY